MGDVNVSAEVPRRDQYGVDQSRPPLEQLFDDLARFLRERRGSQRQPPSLYIVGGESLAESFPTLREVASGRDFVKAPEFSSPSTVRAVISVNDANQTFVLSGAAQGSRPQTPEGLRSLVEQGLEAVARRDDDANINLLLHLPGDLRPPRIIDRQFNPESANYEFLSGTVTDDLQGLFEDLQREQTAANEQLGVDPLLLEWQRRLTAQTTRDNVHQVFATPLSSNELRTYIAETRTRGGASEDDLQDCLLIRFDEQGNRRTDLESVDGLGSRVSNVEIPPFGEPTVESWFFTATQRCQPPNILHIQGSGRGLEQVDAEKPTGCYRPRRFVQRTLSECACLRLLNTMPAVGLASFQFERRGPGGADTTENLYRGDFTRRFDVDSQAELLRVANNPDATADRAPCPPLSDGCPEGWSPPDCNDPTMCFNDRFEGPTALRDFVLDALELFGPEKRVALIYFPGTCARDAFDFGRDIIPDAVDVITDQSLLPPGYVDAHRRAMERERSTGGVSGAPNGGPTGNGTVPVDAANEEESGLPTWAIVLIAVGSVLLAVILIAVVWWLVRRQRSTSDERQAMLLYPRQSTVYF